MRGWLVAVFVGVSVSLASCAVDTAEGVGSASEALHQHGGCGFVAKCMGGYYWDEHRCDCVRERDHGRQCDYVALCAQGYVWDDERCRCVRGIACGPSTCAADEVCCNESCGTCTPPGGYCTEEYCSPAI